MNREIPGYYFDPEKKRYFKIEKGKTAPTTAAWSSDNVKRRKMEADEAEEALRRMRLNKNRIVRSKALNDPLMGGFLVREYGSVLKDVPTASWARSLLEKGGIPLLDAAWRSSSNVQAMYIDGQDTKTGLGVAYATTDEATLLSTYIPRDSNGRVHRQLLHHYRGIDRITPYDMFMLAQLSSINYNKHVNLVLLTSRQPSSECTLWFFHPHETSDDDERPRWRFGPGTTNIYYALRFQGNTSYRSYTTNCTAPAPASSNLICAVGSNKGVLCYPKERRLEWAAQKSFEEDPSLARDIFSLAFLPRNHDILLAGSRNNSLWFMDLRVPCWNWEDIPTSSSITHVKPLNEHQILMSSLQSGLATYDIRYRKSFRRNEATKPVLIFPEYKNAAHIHIGCDVDIASGTVAASHDDGKVALYSVHSGRRLLCPDIDKIHSSHGPIKSLQFQTMPRDQHASLFMGVRSVIQTYSFGKANAGDEE